MIGACALVAGGLLVLMPTSGGALTQITVSTGGDSGPGSLRQAFLDASSGGTAQNDDVEIIIPASVGDITLTTVSLNYDGGNGGGHSLTLTGSGNTIDQTGFTNGVINLSGGTTFTVDNLILTGGASLSQGGAIRSPGATDVVITNSTLTGNTSVDSGGAIHMFGDLTITNSTISENSAISAAGGVFAAGTMTITGSTIIDNTSNAGGGLLTNGLATITNSTITGNEANQGGGVYSQGPVALVYATVVGNTAGEGANLFATTQTLTSFGSVVAEAQGGDSCTGQSGTTSQGYNFEDTDTCGFGSGTGDQVDAGAPGLAALADNGGPTQTMALEAGSPLIDKIPAASPCGGVNVTVDQRGLPRPVTAGQFCDVGAFEIQVAAPIEIEIRFTG